MSDEHYTSPHLKTLEEIEGEGIPDLIEVLRMEHLDTVRYGLWNASGWHRDYGPSAWRNRTTAGQKRKDWEAAVRIEKIIVTVLHAAHARQVEEVMDKIGLITERSLSYESLVGNTPPLPDNQS